MKAATAVGYDLRNTRRILSGMKKSGDKQEDQTISKVLENNNLHLEINSLTINTIEQALAVADVDLEDCAIKSSKVNSWQVHIKTDAGDIVAKTNYQVTVDLSPKIKKPTSRNASSMENSSTRGVKRSHILMSCLQAWEYLAEFAGTSTMSGHVLLASWYIMPVLTPKARASYEGDRMTPRRSDPTTAIGLPRRAGAERSSTEAKKAFNR